MQVNEKALEEIKQNKRIMLNRSSKPLKKKLTTEEEEKYIQEIDHLDMFDYSGEYERILTKASYLLIFIIVVK